MTTAVTPLAASLAMAPATTRAAQAIYGDFHHNTIPAESFLASSSSSAIVASNFHAIKLSSDAQLCPRHLAHLSSFSSGNNNNGGPPVPDCPLGRRCPFRHDAPSSLNFSAVPLRDPGKRTVCKHWLRGLCKKGDSCDYLHEYDLRRMPECRFFATFGFCNSGDECLYLHVDPRAKIRECEEYRRGFCPKGPKCEKKHVRRTACPLYIAGFCPKGPDCRLGHPKTNPPSAQSRSSSPVQTHKPLTAEEAFGPRDRGDRGDQQREYGGGPMRNNFRQPRFNNEGDATQVGGDPYSIPRGERPMGNRPMMGAAGGAGGGKRDLSEVTCFKCGDRGHFANACPNPNKPGNRGGVERGSGGRERGGGGGGGFYHKQQY